MTMMAHKTCIFSQIDLQNRLIAGVGITLKTRLLKAANPFLTPQHHAASTLDPSPTLGTIPS